MRNFFNDESLNIEINKYADYYEILRVRYDQRVEQRFKEWQQINNVSPEDERVNDFWLTWPDQIEKDAMELEKQEFIQYMADNPRPVAPEVYIPPEVMEAIIAVQDQNDKENKEIYQLALQAINSGINPSTQPMTNDIYLNNRIIQQINLILPVKVDTNT